MARGLVGKAITWGAFPVVFGASILAGLIGVERGWDRTLLVAGVNAAAGLLIIVLERVHPFSKDWLLPKGDFRTDLFHAIVSMAVVPELFRALLFGGLYAVGAWLAERAGLGFWPVHWPLFAQLVLALVVAELGYYWVHRMQHTVDPLWRTHATHHAAERLYWLNAARFHPLDVAVGYAAQMVPLILLGCPEQALSLYVIFTGVHGMFQHANIDLKLGPLNWIFPMAEMHRWHHSPVLEEANSNFSSNIVLWDVVFGTRYLPAEAMPPERIGIADMPGFPRGYLAQLASPFQWERVRAESAPAGAAEGTAGGVRAADVAGAARGASGIDKRALP